MNKSKIKAELRRSACEDKEPYLGCHDTAFQRASRWTDINTSMLYLPRIRLRIFFLLVAEAL
jgi:hypothetical protein